MLKHKAKWFLAGLPWLVLLSPDAGAAFNLVDEAHRHWISAGTIPPMQPSKNGSASSAGCFRDYLSSDIGYPLMAISRHSESWSSTSALPPVSGHSGLLCRIQRNKFQTEILP